MKIILASASPRRRELMKFITEDFTAVSVDADETISEDITSEECAEVLASRKARKAHEMFPDDLVIGCDTVVVSNEKILGKPKDKAQAREFMEMLSGKGHTVFTGCCIMYKEHCTRFTEATEVFFDKLSDEEIEAYISTDEPYDKAGGYGIQGKGTLLINGINGDFHNVVGLPVSRLNKALKDFINKNCKGEIMI